MYFVEKRGDTTMFRPVVVNEYGAIPDWPEGFFGSSIFTKGSRGDFKRGDEEAAKGPGEKILMLAFPDLLVDPHLGMCLPRDMCRRRAARPICREFAVSGQTCCNGRMSLFTSWHLSLEALMTGTASIRMAKSSGNWLLGSAPSTYRQISCVGLPRMYWNGLPTLAERCDQHRRFRGTFLPGQLRCVYHSFG